MLVAVVGSWRMSGREEKLRDASSTFHSERQDSVHRQTVCGTAVSRGAGEARDSSQEAPDFQRQTSAFQGSWEGMRQGSI